MFAWPPCLCVMCSTEYYRFLAIVSTNPLTMEISYTVRPWEMRWYRLFFMSANTYQYCIFDRWSHNCYVVLDLVIPTVNVYIELNQFTIHFYTNPSQSTIPISTEHASSCPAVRGTYAVCININLELCLRARSMENCYLKLCWLVPDRTRK